MKEYVHKNLRFKLGSPTRSSFLFRRKYHGALIFTRCHVRAITVFVCTRTRTHTHARGRNQAQMEGTSWPRKGSTRTRATTLRNDTLRREIFHNGCYVPSGLCKRRKTILFSGGRLTSLVRTGENHQDSFARLFVVRETRVSSGQEFQQRRDPLYSYATRLPSP